MKYANSRKTTIVLLILVVGVLSEYACRKDGLAADKNTITLLPKLSAYQVYKGVMWDLVPTDDFIHFSLPTELFSDNASKQRLIKIPGTTRLRAKDNGLPIFPDGTILVKTFFYYHDKRDTTKGKRIVETRILIKADDVWNTGVYVWNLEQTEAFLLTIGTDTRINWIDENGEARVNSYHIPSRRECATCHQSNDKVMPLGPKIRNLNFTVRKDNDTINQLTYLQQTGILEATDPSRFSSLPKWDNPLLPVSVRSRAYLDINCSHCHTEAGNARKEKLYLDYERPFNETGIGEKKRAILHLMEEGKMPMLGTNEKHAEAISLIKTYIQQL